MQPSIDRIGSKTNTGNQSNRNIPFLEFRRYRGNQPQCLYNGLSSCLHGILSVSDHKYLWKYLSKSLSNEDTGTWSWDLRGKYLPDPISPGGRFFLPGQGMAFSKFPMAGLVPQQGFVQQGEIHAIQKTQGQAQTDVR